ncbi:MAG: MFS transporter [Gemmatimonadaceae bacterium]|nr:MFS transporter [Gemmatimonadaceae bacterium]
MTVVPDARVVSSATPTLSAVLRRPAFLLLVAGQTLSQFGDKLHHMALIALVGSGARADTGGIELAKLSVVFTAPVVLFGPLAGALVDRWNKRVTMIVCDALRAILVLAMPALYLRTGHLWSVYVAAFFVFLLGLFFNSAKMALIPDLVQRDELLPANAALTSIGRVATVVGIVGGGIILGADVWTQFGWTSWAAGFYLDSASFVASVITLLGILAVAQAKGNGVRPVAPRETVKRSPRHLVQEVRETIRVVGRTPGLRFAFTSLVLLALFASTVYVAMTLSVQTVMGRGTEGVGYLGGLLAAGMVVGSLTVGSVGSRWRREQLIVWGTCAIGLLMIGAGVWFSFRAFVPVALVGGALLAPVMVAQDTLLHEHAPAESRAVIFSTKDLLVAAVFAASAFIVGGGIYLSGTFGVREPFRWALGLVGATIAVIALAVEGWSLRRRPSQV